jgi:Fe-S-cluster containining protein
MTKATDSNHNASQTPVFQCQQCGDCCSGRGGIFVKPQEVRKMAALLGVTEDEFCQLYLETSAMGPRLTVADNGFCVFLMAGNFCRVHPVKPFICRQWPFLPALLVDADELEHAKTACPGINPVCSHEDFVEAALNRVQTNNLIEE